MASDGFGAGFLGHLGSHAFLSLSALLCALALGIPLAGWCADRAFARNAMLALAGGFRVIPSLAVLTLALPLLGLGFRPALLALVVLALPPIVVATDAALRAVPAPALDAARGLGMTPRQAGLRVRWPLALPFVAVGVRTATIEVIASATLASFIGGGGLGDYIVDGLATNDVRELVLGACAVAALALAADAALGLLQRRLSVA